MEDQPCSAQLSAARQFQVSRIVRFAHFKFQVTAEPEERCRDKSGVWARKSAVCEMRLMGLMRQMSLICLIRRSRERCTGIMQRTGANILR